MIKLILLFSLSIYIGFSQTNIKLKGRISDYKGIYQKNQKLILYKSNSKIIKKVSLTNNLGEFVFFVPKGKYTLNIVKNKEEIFVCKITLRKNIDIGTKKIPEITILSEIILDAEGTKPVKFKQKKIEIDLSNFYTQGDDLTDMAVKIQGFTKNEEGKLLYKNKKVGFLKNGIPFYINPSSINVNDFKKIEIIENPSLEYDSDIEVYINLISKEPNSIFYVSSEPFFKRGIFNSYGLYLSGGYQIKKNKFLHISYSGNKKKSNDFFLNRTSFKNSYKFFETFYDKNVKNNQNNLTLYSILYFDNSTLKIEYMFDGDREYVPSFFLNQKDHNSKEKNTNNSNLTLSILNRGYIHWKHDFSKRTNLSLMVSYLKYFVEDRNKLFFIPNLVENNLDIDLFFCRVNFNGNISKEISYKTGINKNITSTNSTTAGLIFNNVEPKVHYVENIFSTYFLFNHDHFENSLLFDYGLRFEKLDNSFSISRNKFFVNFNLDYLPNPNIKLNANFNQKINRPKFQSINNFIFPLSKFSLYRGNSNLKPSYIENYSVSFVYKEKYRANAFYRNEKWKISKVITYDQTVNKTIFTQQNLNYFDTYGIELGFSSKLFKELYINSTISFLRNELFFKEFAKNNSLNFSFMSKLKLVDKLFITNNFMYNDSMLSGNYKIKGFGVFNMGISFDIQKYIHLSASVQDIFNGYKIIATSITDNFKDYLIRKRESRFLLISLKFYLDKMEQKKISRSELFENEKRIK